MAGLHNLIPLIWVILLKERNNMSDFDEMAREREVEASKLSDLDIWKTVVEKAVKLDVESFVKADILLQSIPDIGVIFSQIKNQYNKGNINDEDYSDLLEILVKKLEDDMGMVDFDPLKYNEED